MIEVGQQAPDFTLRDQNNEEVTLSQFRGKQAVLIIFYPLAFTSVCTQEMCDITSGLNAYSGLNADVIGISVDSPFAQEAWAQKEKIGITLASDLNKETAKAYGTLLPDLIGLGAVSAQGYVIGKENLIRLKAFVKKNAECGKQTKENDQESAKAG